MQWAHQQRLRVATSFVIFAGLCLFFLLRTDPRPMYDGHPLESWLLLLASDDYRDRGRAESALRDLGAESVPELRKALHARETWLGRKFHTVRDRFLPPSQPRVPAYRIRELAAERLWRLGREAAPAAPDLVPRLADRHQPAAEFALLALGTLGPEVTPHLLAGLSAAEAEVRSRCATLLGAGVLSAARRAETVARLTEALADEASSVRAAAALALGSIGDARFSVVAALRSALRDPEQDTVRQAAADGLAALGPGAASAVPDLRVALADDHEAVRLAAAVALWRVTERTDASMPTLLGLLRTSELRWQAAHRLGQMGPEAAAATPLLLERLLSEVVHRPSRVPGTYALALSRMGPVAVPGLIAALDHQNRSVRIQAAMALAGHGTNATPAVPRLRAMLRASDGGVSMAAAETLGMIGPQATVALPDLTRIAEESDSYLRAAALAAVNRIQLASATPSRVREPALD